MQTAKFLAAVLLLSVLLGCGSEGVGIHPEPVIKPDAASEIPAAEITTAPTEDAVAETEPTPSLEPSPSPTERPLEAGELYTFDPDVWRQSLASLSSFRQKAVLEFTSEDGATSKLTYEGKVITSPAALHSLLWFEGRGLGQLPTSQVEVIWIGDEVWVRAGRQPWIKVSASSVESQFSGEVLGIEDLLPRIRGARRVEPDETVNGIACSHYVYDGDGLEAEAGMLEARGDVWVARDAGYVVRLTLSGRGTYYDTYGSGGSLNLVYDLYEVNAPLTITPPR
jgi:hypothetical protein